MSGAEAPLPTARAAVKVSVVVPVYNPGKHLENLVTSLRRQSMPTTDFEVLFVDDGSTDGTGALLDRLAEEVACFQVIHIPNSGWPGKPRNIGLDAAAGEYVYFVDNDDALGDEALERMHRYATENHSDVVVGKEIRRNVRRHVVSLFAENRPRARLGVDPLLAYLNPHKMFRRAFLLEHGLRFPEGPRRLEDHPFVMKAYFAADVISVLSDYPCYYWIQRLDRSNAGLRAREWSEWYSHLRDALDVVVEHTEPGKFRDGLLAHWYRSKGLRLLGAGFAGRSAEDGEALFTALRELTLERYPPSIDQQLPGIFAVISQLLRDGRLDRIRELAAAQRGMRVEHRLESWGWRDGELVVRVSARLVYGDGSPVLLSGSREDLVWCPPVALDDVVDDRRLHFGAGPPNPVDVAIRHRRRFDSYALPGTTEPLPADASGRHQVGAVRMVRLDAGTAAMGEPLPPGTWEIDVQLSAYGWTNRALAQHPSYSPGTPPPPALPVAPSAAGVVSPFVLDNGVLAVAVGSRARAVLGHAEPDRAAARLLVGAVSSALDVPLDGLDVHGEPLDAHVVVGRRGGPALRYQAQITGAGAGRSVVHAALPGRTAFADSLRGRVPAPLTLRVGRERLPLGLELVRRRGRPALRVTGADADPAATGLGALGGLRGARSALRRVRGAAGRVGRRQGVSRE